MALDVQAQYRLNSFANAKLFGLLQNIPLATDLRMRSMKASLGLMQNAKDRDSEEIMKKVIRMISFQFKAMATVGAKTVDLITVDFVGHKDGATSREAAEVESRLQILSFEREFIDTLNRARKRYKGAIDE